MASSDQSAISNSDDRLSAIISALKGLTASSLEVEKDLPRSDQSELETAQASDSRSFAHVSSARRTATDRLSSGTCRSLGGQEAT